MDKKSLPRVVIAGTKSGSGKTVITAMIARRIKECHKRPALFKCGPDYLDPLFLNRVTGEETGNLDSFFCAKDMLQGLLLRESAGRDIALIEGVMGYYDGKGAGFASSTAETAELTAAPVILVIDGKGRSASILAELYGYCQYHPYGKRIAGVILNRTGKKVYEHLWDGIKDMGIIPLGYCADMPEMAFSSRYLGLKVPKDEAEKQIEAASEKASLDIQGIIELAQRAEGLPDSSVTIKSYDKNPVVAIARDEAFCFLYRETVDYLRQAGADVRFFSPLWDEEVPECDAMILCGGYPEDHAKRLSENSSMRRSVRNLIKEGLPVIAECGGFMYLHEEIIARDQKAYSMAGVIKGAVRYAGLCKNFGYHKLELEEDCILGSRGERVKVHEFHHFVSDAKPVFADSLYAGFFHIPFAGNEKAMEHFLDAACRE